MPLAAARESTVPLRVVRRTTAAAALTALGIVYGDLGTSPLYTLHTVVQTIGVRFTPDAALGILSLVCWALVITISAKYCLFVISDNFWHVTVRYGFIEVPDLPAALREAKELASHLDLEKVVYFAARDRSSPWQHRGGTVVVAVTTIRFPVPQLGPSIPPV